MTGFRRIALALLAIVLVAFPSFSCSGDSPTGMDDGSQPDPYSHTDPPGASANDFLSDQTFTSLVVEIDYMTGYAPRSEAVDSLQTFLEQRLNKSSITIQAPTEIPAGGQSTYTPQDILDLEDTHRDEFSNGSTLTAYMLIVDGEFEEGNVLGIAYFNTSTVYFGGAYDQVSGGVTQPSRSATEATSFRHEYGHLFGLVAIEESGTVMQVEHQDEANGHHCDNDQCLMYYAMESVDVFGAAFGSDVPSLDQNCIDDLQANGGR